jgi:hypothetical protein
LSRELPPRRRRRHPVDAVTPLAGQYGLTLEDWAQFWGVPDHVWSNIRRHHADGDPGQNVGIPVTAERLPTPDLDELEYDGACG